MQIVWTICGDTLYGEYFKLWCRVTLFILAAILKGFAKEVILARLGDDHEFCVVHFASGFPPWWSSPMPCTSNRSNANLGECRELSARWSIVSSVGKFGAHRCLMVKHGTPEIQFGVGNGFSFYNTCIQYRDYTDTHGSMRVKLTTCGNELIGEAVLWAAKWQRRHWSDRRSWTWLWFCGGDNGLNESESAIAYCNDITSSLLY